jgi:acetyl esterase/lipase
MRLGKSIVLAAALAIGVAGGHTSATDHSPVGLQPAAAHIHQATEGSGTPITWSEVQALPTPAAGIRVEYGPLPDQFGELRLPTSARPHPVVVLIHGGCWLQEFDYAYFRHLAAAVTDLGIATWTIEYRRIGGAGGWPMTLLDIADAIDYLRELAEIYPLNLQAVIVAGHSAGGHLALWSTTRRRLTNGSDLYRPSPLPIHGVIGLATIDDLATYRVGPSQSCHGAVDPLMGGPPETHPDRYADASPRQRLPLGVPVVLVSGTEDTVVPTSGVQAFAHEAIAAGDRARLKIIDGAGHFDPSVPDSSAWPAVREAVLRLVDAAGVAE